MQKRATSKRMEANRNFGRWLSYGRGIAATFGKHLLYLVTKATVNNSTMKTQPAKSSYRIKTQVNCTPHPETARHFIRSTTGIHHIH